MSVEERLARNELMFRAVNENIRDLASRFDTADEAVSFVCECADETCVERVRMTLAQYDEMRVLPARFVVVPGHEATPLVERVVFRSPAFVLVRKVGIAADAVLRRFDDEPE